MPSLVSTSIGLCQYEESSDSILDAYDLLIWNYLVDGEIVTKEPHYDKLLLSI